MKKILVFLLLLSSICHAQYINVRIYDGVDSFRNDFWNNWKITNTGALNYSSPVFTDMFGNKTTVQAQFDNTGTAFDNGPGYALNKPLAPDTVLRKGRYFSDPGKLTFYGLNDSALYSISFYCSRINIGGSNTSFTINGVAQTVLTDTNTVRVVVFNNVAPVKGNIIVSFKALKTFSYMDGFQLIGVAKNPPVTAKIIADSTTITGPNSIVKLTDSSTGNRHTQQFMQNSGPTAAIVTPYSDRGWLLSGLFPGKYAFTYMITDTLGNSSSYPFTITVNPYKCPVCPPVIVCPPPVICPAPRTVTGATYVITNGVMTVKFIYSDGNP